MSLLSRLPTALAARAERRTWFERKDAAQVLDWIAESNLRFLGMDVSEKRDDGNWMLLIHPILDLSAQTDNREAIALGHEFLAANDLENRMFEPVWEGRSK